MDNFWLNTNTQMLCSICGETTQYIDIGYNQPFCSDKCLEAKHAEVCNDYLVEEIYG